MPATTRSVNKQVMLEEVGAGNSKASQPRAPPPVTKKRKVNGHAQAVEQSKKAKGMEETDDDGDYITVHRTPVLELWASCVTRFMYPSLPWSACLRAGGAIPAATAKGHSIWTIDKPDPSEAEKRRQQRREKAEREHLDELEVMSFEVPMSTDGQAALGVKPKKGNEAALRRKYGDGRYETVRKTFKDALQSWKGKEDDLDKHAFRMYKMFKPRIIPGQSGWTRKGRLNLDSVKSAIASGGRVSRSLVKQKVARWIFWTLRRT